MTTTSKAGLLKHNTLGDITAEGDKKLLDTAFIETPEYRSLLESSDRPVVVGRRGTGKSAMFLRLAEHWADDKTTTVIKFAPEDYQVIGFRAMLAPFETKFTYVKAVTRILWRYALTIEIARAAQQKQIGPNAPRPSQLLASHIEQWGNDSVDLMTKLRRRFDALRNNQSVEQCIGDLPLALDLPKLEHELDLYMKEIKTTVVILIDRLDEGYEPDNVGIGAVAGVVTAVSETNKRYERVRPVVFLRDNISRALAKLDHDYTRNLEGELIRIHWDSYQLLNFIAARLKVAFEIDQEQSQKIWDRCTAGELQHTDGFHKCLQFTLYRPRDLLSLLNEAFYLAAKEGRATIVVKDLENAAKNISTNRLEDLWKEYHRIFPTIEPATRAFANGNPEVPFGAALALLDVVCASPVVFNTPEMAQEVSILQGDGLIRALYSVGFLGVHDKTTDTFVFCHDGRNPDKEFVPQDRILLHPCYWIALNLTKNVLDPGEAETINDEYEIQISSLTPKIRATRLGGQISELNEIPFGHEGQTTFENWALATLKIVFAQHLANLELHPNKNAVQRRDIVGTNLTTTPVWHRIRDDYDVRQVIFEVKNYEVITRDDYRQTLSYLHDKYGRLAFIVTRAVDENLHKEHEVDWMREMYISHKVLIMKLPAKFLTRVLSKLRNPEKHDTVDRLLSALLDTYERNYLSLKVTKRSGARSRPQALAKKTS